MGKRTATAIGAECEVLAGCGHFVPQERRERVARAVLQLAASTGDVPRPEDSHE